MLRHDHPLMQTFRHLREHSNWTQRMKIEREEGYRAALEEIMYGNVGDEIEKMDKTIAELNQMNEMLAQAAAEKVEVQNVIAALETLDRPERDEWDEAYSNAIRDAIRTVERLTEKVVMDV